MKSISTLSYYKKMTDIPWSPRSNNKHTLEHRYGTAASTDMSILRKCTADCDKMLRWMQEYLQSKYPYNDEKEVVYHKQVFVHGLEIPDTESVTPPHVLPLGGMFSGMKSFCTLVRSVRVRSGGVRRV